MKEIRTQIQIKATPDKIWQVLTDIDKFPQWNPFIKSIKGTLAAGQKITVRMEPLGASGMTFNPKVLKLDTGKEFRWLGHLIIPDIFDGEHIFEIIDNKDGTCLFIQRELFKGILVPFLKKMLDNNTKRGFELMNEKLKEICENPI